MATSYFKNCKTIEELKKEYKRLCKKMHPDCGGDHDAFIAMTDEYTKRFETLKREHNRKARSNAGSGEKVTDETAQEFIDIINKIIGIDGIEIEICGTWIWVGGDTKPNKEAIKAAGFHFSGKQKRWYWHPVTKSKKWHRSSGWSMDEIRAAHGSTKIA